MKGLFFGFVFCFATFKMFYGIHVLSVCIINGRCVAFSAMLLTSDEPLNHLELWFSNFVVSRPPYTLIENPKEPLLMWVISIEIYCI